MIEANHQMYLSGRMLRFAGLFFKLYGSLLWWEDLWEEL